MSSYSPVVASFAAQSRMSRHSGLRSGARRDGCFFMLTLFVWGLAVTLMIMIRPDRIEIAGNIQNHPVIADNQYSPPRKKHNNRWVQWNYVEYYHRFLFSSL